MSIGSGGYPTSYRRQSQNARSGFQSEARAPAPSKTDVPNKLPPNRRRDPIGDWMEDVLKLIELLRKTQPEWMGGKPILKGWNTTCGTIANYAVASGVNCGFNTTYQDQHLDKPLSTHIGSGFYTQAVNFTNTRTIIQQSPRIYRDLVQGLFTRTVFGPQLLTRTPVIGDPYDQPAPPGDPEPDVVTNPYTMPDFPEEFPYDAPVPDLPTPGPSFDPDVVPAPGNPPEPRVDPDIDPWWHPIEWPAPYPSPLPFPIVRPMPEVQPGTPPIERPVRGPGPAPQPVPLPDPFPAPGPGPVVVPGPGPGCGTGPDRSAAYAERAEASYGYAR